MVQSLRQSNERNQTKLAYLDQELKWKRDNKGKQYWDNNTNTNI